MDSSRQAQVQIQVGGLNLSRMILGARLAVEVVHVFLRPTLEAEVPPKVEVIHLN